MRHLYQKIYLTIIASLVLLVIVAGLVFRVGSGGPIPAQGYQLAGELFDAVLPPATAAANLQRDALAKLAGQMRTDLSLYDNQRQLIAASGPPLPPPPERAGDGWFGYGPRGAVWSVRLPDDRWIVAHVQHHRRSPIWGLMAFLGAIALIVALCAYPVVRGLTRRIERLQQGVETLGAGDLTARVKVQGRDEIAALAASFNKTAEHVEKLVHAHRMLLANVSHELRTPVARARLGLQLLIDTKDPKYKASIEHDLHELEEMIEDVLLVSRLDVLKEISNAEEIDLLAFVAEEAARYPDCNVSGESVTLRGDPRLLRVLVRNLIENGLKHGKAPVDIDVRCGGSHGIIEVCDEGNGVAAKDRAIVFETFEQRGGTGNGAGLGLALVRRIAQLHGGNVEIIDRAGTRSCFRATLACRNS